MLRVRGWRAGVAALALALLVPTACDDPAEPDNPVCTPDDAFEQNDSVSTAAAVGVGSHAALLCLRGRRPDPDFYRFDGRAGRSYRVRVENTASPTGWSVEVLDDAGASVARAADGTFAMPAGGRAVFAIVPTTTALNAGRDYRLVIEQPNQGPAPSISAAPAAPEVDDEVTFTGTATDPEGDAIAVWTWRFGDGTSATGASATHRYGARGTYTVRLVATDEFGARDSTAVQLTVSQAVTSVQVTPATLVLAAIGDTARLTAVALDRGGRTVPEPVTWRSSAGAVATVSSTGLVTAVAVGDAVITAEAAGVPGTASVSVAQAVHAITITPAAPALGVDDSLQLAAVARDRLGTAVPGVSFTWASADTNVAAVSATGMLRGRAAGSTSITASGGGAQASVTATVHPPAPASAETGGGGQSGVVGAVLAQPIGVRLLDALGRPVPGVTVSFSAQDGSVASAEVVSDVDGWARTGWTLGTVAGQQRARATIPGLGDVDFTATAEPGAPATLTLDRDSVHFVALGALADVDATVHDAYGNMVSGAAVSWSIADTLIARVGTAGEVTPVGNGSTTLTAQSGSAQASVPVVVRQVVTGLSLSPTSTSVKVGDTVRITATAYDATQHVIPDASIDWSSANLQVASVDGFGLVGGVAEGSTTITASSGGVQRSASVTVVPSGSAARYFQVVRGNHQVGYAGELARDSILVYAFASLYCHSDGCEPTDPVAGATVLLRAGAGSLESTSVVTDQDGRAAIGYTYGAATGVDSLRVWIPGAEARVGWSTYQDTAFVQLLVTSHVDAAQFTSVSGAGDYGGHTCALTSDGTAWCWGDNGSGQLGIGTWDWDMVDIPVRVAGDRKFSQVSTAGWHTCAVALDGTAWCWGDSDQVGSEQDYDTNVPVPVTTTERFTKLAAGMWTTCGIATTGRLWCWGDGSYGALGNGSTNWSQTPVASASTLSFSDVAMGTIFYGCAISTAGDAWCWGANSSGQLGDSTRTPRYEPVRVVGGHSFRQVTAHEDHTCALTPAGVAYCWGYNGDGVLGNGQESVMGAYWNTEPQLVLGGHAFSDLSTGYAHTCAVHATTNLLYCWGGNWDGQFGTGSATPAEAHSPVLAAGGLTFDRVAAALDFTCGLRAGGELWCWGVNGSGELGLGTTADPVLSPARVGGQPPAGNSLSLPLLREQATSTPPAARAPAHDRDAARAEALRKAAGR